MTSLRFFDRQPWSPGWLGAGVKEHIVLDLGSRIFFASSGLLNTLCIALGVASDHNML
jgi:hypothetical protein